MTLSGWWWWAGRCWNLPANHAGARPQLQTVQVIQVSEGRGQRTGSRSVSGPIVFCSGSRRFLPGDVVFGIFAIVGKSTKKVAPASNQREAVSKTGAGGWAILWRFGLQTFPLPATRLKV